MKIRIQGNSIRLRVSQAEVKLFGETGIVREFIQFGTSAEESLHYTLERSNVSSIGVSYAVNEIRIFVPVQLADDWVSSDQVGMEHDMSLGHGKSLRILVEKDFKCLTPRGGEDETDNFPNPKASC